MDEKAFKKLTRARSILILDHPFFGSLSLRLRLREVSGIPTLAVDGREVIYNPQFINGLSDKLTQSAMGHEVLHCVYQHITRRGGRDPYRWNCAIDYVVNETLKECGMEIGDGWLYDKKYKGMTADEIYNLLPETPADKKKSYGGTGEPLCNADGSACGDGKGDGKGDGAGIEMDQSARAYQERDWKVATIQAYNVAKQLGRLPGAIERVVTEVCQPQVNWKERLRNFVTQVNKDDYDWTKPQKRLIGHGVFLPSLYSEAIGDIVLVVDTSGSIDDKTLAAFESEINCIISDTKPTKVHVIYCDAAINKAVEFEQGEPVKLKGYGGGGTDFRPPFKYVTEKNISPECLVYLTDLYGPMDETPPDYPVMWVCTTNVVAKWGDTIPIKI